MKFTQKQLKEIAKNKIAIDITYEDQEKIQNFNVKQIGLSFGVYGMNGGLFQDNETGQLYVITSRSTNLFILA